MNSRQLQKLGVPRDCIQPAIAAVQALAGQGVRKNEIKARVTAVVKNPAAYVTDDLFATLATSLEEHRRFVLREPIEYQTWGAEQIDDASRAQIEQACRLPVAVAAALMPDAHVGYGLPIGGVLACENAVIPYAVGVDIACRMKMSVIDMPLETLKTKKELFKDALQHGTRFGVGVQYDDPQSHPVMDQDWTVTPITREKKDKAWKQLGTSGSGNHFVEFGLLSLEEPDQELGLDAGRYLALLSHSGSRGPGAAVCSAYSAIAQSLLPRQYKQFGRLAWLDMDRAEGQEYWAAMNLMGDYASANHHVIHRLVTERLGTKVIASVENHHNFAWKERHAGNDVIVHRKGATPAGIGMLGVIPGSMADPAFVVRGKGNAKALHSASHGAGRRMSRKKAKERYCFEAERKKLAARGIDVLSAGADEVPGVYKDIREVMRQQQDLVGIIAQFDPKIVKMSGDGRRAV